MIRQLTAIGLLLFSTLGYTQTSKVDLVRVEKSQRTLYLMSGGKVLHEYKIALGGSPVGHKEREGDQRTPEGRYTLDYKKADSAYFRAIHISYPNKQDKENARRLGSPKAVRLSTKSRTAFYKIISVFWLKAVRLSIESRTVF